MKYLKYMQEAHEIVLAMELNYTVKYLYFKLIDGAKALNKTYKKYCQ